MLKFVLKVSCFFRKITSPILWFLIKPFLKKPDKNYWDEMKKLILKKGEDKNLVVKKFCEKYNINEKEKNKIAKQKNNSPKK